MAKLVSKRYAEALFEAGLELNVLEKFKEDIAYIMEIIKKEEMLQKVLKHPKISKDEKKELLTSIFKEKVSNEFLNFLYIVVDKRREGFLLEISKEFIKLYNEHNNILEVTAVTAVEMDNKIKDKLITILSNRTSKTIILNNVIDKDIIGGVLLKIENKIIDGTIKAQLENLEKAIKGATI
ncbi:F0F1 ATP synthase subunit delta [Tepidimicrobium xylanilyticum]|uniref:ATP synthase subunit delta n=1 Tax=Tepidimicrobium xylanilyticum TaxID=1123352 RepID=A0A1H2QZD1_9FIRM|nr:F0F1 ATP synthase subunit delta [Tepidimicrobium xylanilyticum]GMG95550.1 ATP synthase subunit delta [Tepidimicrobium xylanilyticum]SDW12471.1 ATP synthase F1 subcomplex delta subunit [Tepidimicrobium xylanilyticum]